MMLPNPYPKNLMRTSHLPRWRNSKTKPDAIDRIFDQLGINHYTCNSELKQEEKHHYAHT